MEKEADKIKSLEKLKQGLGVRGGGGGTSVEVGIDVWRRKKCVCAAQKVLLRKTPLPPALLGVRSFTTAPTKRGAGLGIQRRYCRQLALISSPRRLLIYCIHLLP